MSEAGDDIFGDSDEGEVASSQQEGAGREKQKPDLPSVDGDSDLSDLDGEQLFPLVAYVSPTEGDKAFFEYGGTHNSIMKTNFADFIRNQLNADDGIKCLGIGESGTRPSRSKCPGYNVARRTWFGSQSDIRNKAVSRRVPLLLHGSLTHQSSHSLSLRSRMGQAHWPWRLGIIRVQRGSKKNANDGESFMTWVPKRPRHMPSWSPRSATLTTMVFKTSITRNSWVSDPKR